MHSLRELAGPRGTLVMFICNHCPYVRAVLPRIVRDVRELLPWVCMPLPSTPMTNAAIRRQLRAHEGLSKEWLFPFHYLHDTTQDVARAYDAVCTPDFYGFDADLRLQYRGRLDASRKEAAPDDSDRVVRRHAPDCALWLWPRRATCQHGVLDQMEALAPAPGAMKTWTGRWCSSVKDRGAPVGRSS